MVSLDRRHTPLDHTKPLPLLKLLRLDRSKVGRDRTEHVSQLVTHWRAGEKGQGNLDDAC
jgi:hypothetical protein